MVELFEKFVSAYGLASTVCLALSYIIVQFIKRDWHKVDQLEKRVQHLENELRTSMFTILGQFNSTLSEATRATERSTKILQELIVRGDK